MRGQVLYVDFLPIRSWIWGFCRRPPSPPAPSSMSNISMLSPIAAIFKIEDIEACENGGDDTYVPQPQWGSSVKNGLFRKDEFRYDAARDVYVCPAGEALSRNHESTLRDLKRFHYTNPAACSACPLRVRAPPPPTVVRSRGWRTRLCSTAWRRD